MEVTLRGILEKEIEEMASPEVLEVAIITFQKRFPTKSMEDYLFGYVVGFLFGRFASLIKLMGRPATQAEVKEFWKMMEKRTLEIRGKIKLALGR